MVMQPRHARVCSSSQSLEASSRVTGVGADIPQLKEALRQRQQIGVATGLLFQRFAISPERAWTLAADNADDENTGVAGSKLSILKDKP
jgi:AmiR/NasT family two-component response regulator